MYRLSYKGVVTLLLLTAAYFVSFFLLPMKVRYLLMIGTVIAIVFQFRFKPGFWLPLLPMVFMAGGSILTIGEFHPAIATIVMIAFTFFYIFDRIVWNKPLFVPSYLLFLIFIAILIQVVSVFISVHFLGQHPLNAIREGSSVFLFSPLVVIIPILCRTEKQFNQLLRAVLIATLVASVIGVLQYLSITGFSRVDIGIGYFYRGRVASLFGNPNIFAGYLELGIPLAIALAFREKDIRWKVVAVAAVASGILGVLYSFSRGGLICLFIGCGIILMYIFRRKIWIPVLMGVMTVFVLIKFASTFERQMSFFMDPKSNMTQPTLLHRYITYRGFLNQFSEAPIAGVGWGAKEFYWGRSILYSFWEVRFGRSTQMITSFGGLNSVFLNYAIKGGVIALGSVLLMFAALYAAFFRALRKGKDIIAVAIIAGIFGFMIHQIVGNQLRFPTVNSLFWFLSGLLFVLTESDFRKDKKVENKKIKESAKPILNKS